MLPEHFRVLDNHETEQVLYSNIGYNYAVSKTALAKGGLMNMGQRSRAASIISSIFVMAFVAKATLAQNYPSKPIRFVVPMAAGGGIDIVARMAGLKLSESTKQPILIENRPGAGGTIGPTFVTNATPDGYTILFISSSQAIAVSLYKDLPYDLARDFAPITQLTSSPQLLVVRNSLPVMSVQELIASAKAYPGKLNYASAGVASSTHVAMELFKTMTGINMNGTYFSHHH